MSPLTIAIIGGGIAGPAAAVGLARNGHQVKVLERTDARAEDVGGFAFRVMPNAERCLRFLGVAVGPGREGGGAVVADRGRLMTGADGRVVHEIVENPGAQGGDGGGGGGLSVFAYRPSLQRQLYEKMAEVGVQVRTGVRVVSADVVRNALLLDDGTEMVADLIIGADGVRSALRPHIVGDSPDYDPKPSTGQGCLRFTIPREVIAADPVTAPIAEAAAEIVSGIAEVQGKGRVTMFGWMGAGKRIIVYPVNDGKLFNFNCTHPEEMSRQETSSGDSSDDAVAYNQPISPATVAAIYSDFDPVSRRLLQIADPAGLRVWRLMDLDDLPRWSTGPGSLLIGDAAHLALPFSYSGAAMAIEDAITLAVLLPREAGREDLGVRLRLFEEIRRPRVARVRDMGRQFGQGREDPASIREYRAFLGAHDAVAFARERLAEEQL